MDAEDNDAEVTAVKHQTSSGLQILEIEDEGERYTILHDLRSKRTFYLDDPQYRELETWIVAKMEQRSGSFSR